MADGEADRIYLLFVYGTLLSADLGTAGRAQRERLAREARVLGPATVPGRLYHLGRYPGLVLVATGTDIVHGELLELSSPATTLRWLDAYEGIVRGDHAHNEYERRIVDAAHAGGTWQAWIYAYIQPIDDKTLIDGGRWLPES